VLGQVLIEDAGKNHEIQAAQRLIETLGLAGRLYTLDALHLQKNG
jgi:predicted transposase YbfD/YdcC